LVGIGADVLLGWVRAGESRRRAGRAPLLSHALGALVVALSTLGIESWVGQLPYGAEQAREIHRQDAAYATLAGLQGDARIWLTAGVGARHETARHPGSPARSRERPLRRRAIRRGARRRAAVDRHATAGLRGARREAPREPARGPARVRHLPYAADARPIAPRA